MNGYKHLSSCKTVGMEICSSNEVGQHSPMINVLKKNPDVGRVERIPKQF